MLDNAYGIFDGTLPNTGVAITATTASTNVLDLLSARDVGVGDDLYFHVLVTTSFTSTNSGTLQVAFQSCSTAGGTYKDLVFSPAVAASNLIAGLHLVYEVPHNNANNATAGLVLAPNRFVRLNYTVTNALAAGAIMSWLAPAPDSPQFVAYPNNYVVAIAANEI